MPLDRRSFLKASIAGAGAAAVGGRAHASDFINITKPTSTLLGGPPPRYKNIEHVVVVMMENRSTDHYLGWWGEKENVRFDARTTLDSGGLTTADWGANGDPDFAQHRNYTGHGFQDPGHSHSRGRVQLRDHDRDGTPDGWLEDGSRTDEYALSYYTDADLPVIARIVQDFTAFDRYFSSWMGNTYPNRYYMHSAQAHGIDNNDTPPEKTMDGHHEHALGFNWPTLWDKLTHAGVTWKYYYSNLPAIALFGPRNAANTRHITEYYADAAAGTLPQVAFVDPFFVAPEGLANDDHPHADIRLGQEFYSDVITAFLRSPNWFKGAMFINYDEWGGFWDHVVPPVVANDVDPYSPYAPGQSPDYTDPNSTGPVDFGLYGFRTPAFLLSPHARNTGRNAPQPRSPGAFADNGPTIDRTVSSQHDHTTILQFIAENWGLADIGDWAPGSRAAQGSMADAFHPSFRGQGDGAPEVDVEAYEYVAPPEARSNPYEANPASSVSDLWDAADWIESSGFEIHTRFEDALPEHRTLAR